MIIKLTKELIQKDSDVEFSFRTFRQMEDRIADIITSQDLMDLAAVCTHRNTLEISVNCHDCGIQSPVNELISLHINTHQNEFNINLCRTCHLIRHTHTHNI